MGGGTMLRGELDGQIRVDRQAAGLFLRDARALSERRITVDGRMLGDAGHVTSPSSHRVALLPQTSRGEAPDLVAILTQTVDAAALWETLVVHNLTGEARTIDVSITAATDAADPFALRSDRRTFDRTGGRLQPRALPDGVAFDYARGAYRVISTVQTEPAPQRVEVASDDRLLARATLGITVALPAHGSATVHLRTSAATSPDERTPVTAALDASPEPDAPPTAGTGTGTGTLKAQALADLAALRMPAPGLPEARVVGAGAPWFLTLFGRDSILTALLAADDVPELLSPVLRALAAHQATDDDPARAAQPGKIPHEVRIDELSVLGEVPYGRYYGTVDATPLFLIALGHAPHDVAAELEANARAAVAWLRGPGGLDEDGFLTYTPDPSGLKNQGWKDSFDAVAHADGTLAEGSIALCEAQGYAWRALVETARLAREVWADAAWARELEALALALRERFRDRFWSDRLGVPALALDGAGRLVEVVSSNIGHVLWSGILDAAEAAAVSRRLLAPDMLTSWGLRTLSTDAALYSPLSYHNGSVWPHDTALAAVGMGDAGLDSDAKTLATAILEAARSFNGTLPELFGGLDRDAFPTPIAYPFAARPQAWAAAAVVAAVRLVG